MKTLNTILILALLNHLAKPMIKVPLHPHHIVHTANGTSAKGDIINAKYGHLKDIDAEAFKNGSIDVNHLRQKQKENMMALAHLSAGDDYGQGGTIKVGLNSFMHIAYLGPINLGVTADNKSQEAMVVYDTGSSWLSVTSSMCSNCPIKSYDLKKTTTEVTVDYKLEHEYYGRAEILGQMVTDTVCLVNLADDTDRNTCVKEFPFLAITE